MSYPVGTEVAGTVSGVTSYGAFVTLPDGSTGMIHISKLSRRFVIDIHAVIKTGDTVKATVISNENNKTALSLIAGKEEPEPKRDLESMLDRFRASSEERLKRSVYGEKRKGDRKRR